jgi:hypothetical protein
MSAPIKTFDCYETTGHEDVEALYVLHADHLASHAFDEAKDRVAFELYVVGIRPFLGVPPLRTDGGVYPQFWLERSWQSWLACAKSRAKAAGCI